jgi:hypothetical protein
MLCAMYNTRYINGIGFTLAYLYSLDMMVYMVGLQNTYAENLGNKLEQADLWKIETL